MKKKLLIGLTTVCLSLSNQAKSSDLNSPLFKPEKGAFLNETRFDYISKKQNIVNNNGTVTDKENFKTKKIQNILQYGFTDSLSAKINLNYVPKENKKTNTTKTKSDGWYSPDISLSYRIKEQNNSNYILDVFGGFEVDLGTWSEATADRKGDAYGSFKGYKYYLGSRVGKKINSFDLSAFAKIMYNDSSDTEVLNTPVLTYKISDSFDKKIGIETLYSFNENFSANIDCIYNIVGTWKSTRKSNGVYRKFKGGNELKFGTQLNYNISKNKSVNLFGSYSLIDDISVSDSSNSALNYKYKNHEIKSLGIGFKYLF